MKNRVINFTTDLFNLILIGFIGYILIGYFLNYTFLNTNNQDWLFHASQAEQIQKHGIQSWDHRWANGNNTWRGFTFIPYMPILAIMHFAAISATQAMIIATVSLFVGVRLITYAILRSTQTKKSIAFLASILSYTIPIYWETMHSFTIYLSSFVIALYIWLWIYSFKQTKAIYLVAAGAGLGWVIHPLVGFTLTLLLIARTFIWQHRNSPKYLALLLVIWLPGILAYVVPQLQTDSQFTNPYLSTNEHAQDLFHSPYLGLGLIYAGSIIIGWIACLTVPEKLTTWSKLLLISLSTYLILILSGNTGIVPGISSTLQLAYGMLHVAILLPFIFADVIKALFPSKLLLMRGFLTALLAFGIVESIEVATIWSPYPTSSTNNSVISHLNEQNSNGSIYYKEIGEASLFANPNVAFANSYRDQLLPSPLSLRLQQLFKNDYTYTSLSHSQAQLINNYALVLGIEYLVIPEDTPIDEAINSTDEKLLNFTQVAHIGSQKIFQHATKQAKAYMLERQDFESIQSTDRLSKPTLSGESYVAWDSEIAKLAELLRSKNSTPIEIRYPVPHTMSITLPPTEVRNQYKNPIIILNQHDDPNWVITDTNITKHQTATGLMYFEIPSNVGQTFAITNTWPTWYWPLQISPVLLVLITLLYTIIPSIKPNWHLNVSLLAERMSLMFKRGVL